MTEISHVSTVEAAVYIPEGKDTSAQGQSQSKKTENVDPTAVRPYSSVGQRVLPPSSVAPAEIAESNPPPSYESLFGKIKKAKENSKTRMEYCSALKKILSSADGVLVIMALCLLPAVATIVIGGVYFNDCSVDGRIPLLLLLFGVSLVLLFSHSLYQGYKIKKEKADRKMDAPLMLFLFFAFIVFLMSNSAVYGNVGRFVDHPTKHPRYCHPTLLWYAFGTITFIWFLVFLCLLYIILAACVIPKYCAK